MRYVNFILGFLMVILITGCGNPHDKYIGYWKKQDEENTISLIKKVDNNIYTVVSLEREKNGLEGGTLVKLDNGEFETGGANSTRIILSEDGNTIREDNVIWNRISEQQAEEAWVKIQELAAKQQKNAEACEKMLSEYKAKRDKITNVPISSSSDVSSYFDQKDQQNKQKTALFNQYQTLTESIPDCSSVFKMRYSHDSFSI